MAEKKKISVVVGKPLSEDIMSHDGSKLLVGKGIIVTRQMVLKLSNWIVEEEPRGPVDRSLRQPVEKKVRDEILKRLEFEEIVSRKTREQLEQGVDHFFKRVGGSASKLSVAEIEQSIATLVDETPENPDVPFKLFQLKGHATYIYQHAIECGVIASFVAAQLNYPTREITSFVTAMMLHETGILSVPDAVINKSERLTDEEWELIRMHPKNGWEILKTVAGVDPLAMMVALGHHVTADGTGYPEEVDFNDLPPLVHLASVINDFEALTADRPYRKGFPLHDAVKILLNQREKYHPGAITDFVRVIGIFPISTFVRLNTMEVGVVVRNNPETLFLPEVKLVLDPAGKRFSREIIIDLFRDPERRISDTTRSV